MTWYGNNFSNQFTGAAAYGAKEQEELRALAERIGGHRCYRDGIGFWHMPPWICDHCGPNAEVQPGCPQPLARHGKIDWPECFR